MNTAASFFVFNILILIYAFIGSIVLFIAFRIGLISETALDYYSGRMVYRSMAYKTSVVAMWPIILIAVCFFIPVKFFMDKLEKAFPKQTSSKKD